MVKQAEVVVKDFCRIGFGIMIFFLITPSFPGHTHFIISAPQRQRRMVSQPFHIFDSLLFYIFQKSGIARIKAAGKHKILPYQDPIFITQIIKFVILVNSATPNPDHVHVYILCCLNEIFVFLFCNPGQKIILWDIVGPFHKDRNSIKFYIKTFTISIGLLNNLERTNTKTGDFFINLLPLFLQTDRKTIEMGLAQTISPPPFRMVYKKLHIDPVQTFVQSNFSLL